MVGLGCMMQVKLEKELHFGIAIKKESCNGKILYKYLPSDLC
jgi:hypothetical protein